MKKLISQFDMVQTALLISLVLLGGMIEVFACVAAVILAVMLVLTVRRSGRFIFRLSFVSVAALSIPLGYLVTIFYAVDTGMALLGFLKYAGVALFLLLIQQQEGTFERTIALLPYVTLALGVISLPLMFIPGSPFAVAGRLAGFFEYPNSFAMLLLLGALAVLSPDELKWHHALVCALLFILIIFTGSRGVLVTAVISAVILLLTKKQRRVRLFTAAAVLILLAAGLALYFLRGDNEFLNRLFSFSLRENTLVDRLLYDADSLRLIVSHPFGMGYMGYSYLEHSIQTGLYSVRDVHNSVLQLALDIGWIPALLFVGAVFRSLFSRRFTPCRRVMLAALFVHSLFDFDLSYPAMLFLLLILLETDAGKVIKPAKNTVILVGLVGIAELYFAFHTGLWYGKAYAPADALYPYNTENASAMMLGEEDLTVQNSIADRILTDNSMHHAACSVKAAYAYSRGDLSGFIEYKHRIFEIVPFSYEEYEDYAYKLAAAVNTYQAAGDDYSVRLCAAELVDTKRRLAQLSDRLSALGRMIQDQPVTELPEELSSYIDSLPQ